MLTTVKLKTNPLVNALHDNGLSDLAMHLDLYLKFATPVQIASLERSVVQANSLYYTKNKIEKTS